MTKINSDNSLDTEYKTNLNNAKTKVINLLSNKKLFLENIEHIIKYLKSSYNNSSTTVTSADHISELNKIAKDFNGLHVILTCIENSDIDIKLINTLKLLINSNLSNLTALKSSLLTPNTSNKIPENLYDAFKKSEYLHTIEKMKEMVTNSDIEYNYDIVDTINEQIESMLLHQKEYELQECIANNIIKIIESTYINK